MSKNPLIQTLISMTGQSNVITIHRPFVDFTNSLEAAMMLSQLLYWTPKAVLPGGWIAKSDKDWKKELGLKRYGHRNATKILKNMGIIETKIKKFRGAPTTHYRVKWDALENKWSAWVLTYKTEDAETDDETSEIE
jgi:hypothetical protein